MKKEIWKQYFKKGDKVQVLYQEMYRTPSWDFIHKSFRLLMDDWKPIEEPKNTTHKNIIV